MGIQYYIGMLVPFILIYVFNWIIFVIIIISVLYKNWYKFASKHASQGQKSGVSVRQQFMIVVTLSVLFGIGWGIGLLATEEIGNSVAHDFFSSLFVIITSFHGLLIFILHCVRSKEARKEWRRWFFKATRKGFSDFTSSRLGHIQVHLKTSSLQPLSQSSSSKTPEKFEVSASAVSSLFLMTDDGGAVKSNMMKQCESETVHNIQSMEETAYERQMKPERDTDFTKVDLANIENKQANTSNVNSGANSSDQVVNILQESHCSVTITLSDPDDGEPNADQSYFQNATEEKNEKAVQQDEEQYREETKPDELKEQKYARHETSATKPDFKMVLPDLDQVSPIPPAVEEDKAYHLHVDESKA